jgi:protein tyrosine phosphatase (PTP) superfamily phosphohydrolase (DUF442 family)
MRGLDKICNYLEISGSIGTAGQPTPEQFIDIKSGGYDVVVNLAMPDSTNALANECDLVTEQGMEYVHLPVVWEKPTDADLDKFFGVMSQHQRQRVFVHCALNWRVSCFILLYRVICQGISQKKAQEALLTIWEPDATWQGFMSRSLARHGVEPWPGKAR